MSANNASVISVKITEQTRMNLCSKCGLPIDPKTTCEHLTATVHRHLVCPSKQTRMNELIDRIRIFRNTLTESQQKKFDYLLWLFSVSEVLDMVELFRKNWSNSSDTW